MDIAAIISDLFGDQFIVILIFSVFIIVCWIGTLTVFLIPRLRRRTSPEEKKILVFLSSGALVMIMFYVTAHRYDIADFRVLHQSVITLETTKDVSQAFSLINNYLSSFDKKDYSSRAEEIAKKMIKRATPGTEPLITEL